MFAFLMIVLLPALWAVSAAAAAATGSVNRGNIGSGNGSAIVNPLVLLISQLSDMSVSCLPVTKE